VGEDPSVCEGGSNDSAASAEPITAPVVINGTIETDYDEDFYRFEAGAGETLLFRVDAERVGSRLDARLVLLDAAGKDVASNDDARGLRSTLKWDPEIVHTFKEAGRFLIKVSSQQRSGGPGHVYALAVRRARPQFSLATGAERLSLGRGDTASWSVSVQRLEGFAGEVTVAVDGLPAGVTAKPLAIPADKSGGKLELSAREDAALGLAPVAIVGHARIEGRDATAVAFVPAARISGSGPGFASFVSTQPFLTVTPPTLFSIEAALTELSLLRGQTAEVGVKLARRRGFDGPVHFALDGAPAGVTVAGAEIVDQGRLARFTLRATPDTPMGRSPVILLGTRDANPAGRAIPAPRLTIQVN
jgi:hypothetical protein